MNLPLLNSRLPLDSFEYFVGRAEYKWGNSICASILVLSTADGMRASTSAAVSETVRQHVATLIAAILCAWDHTTFAFSEVPAASIHTGAAYRSLLSTTHIRGALLACEGPLTFDMCLPSANADDRTPAVVFLMYLSLER